MKIEELRSLIDTKTAEVRGFVAENKAEEAKTAMEELRGLKENLKIAEELEEEERRSLENQKNNKEERGTKTMETNELRSLVKHVMGKEMTAEERATIKSIDHGAVLPKQFVNKLQELKKGFGSLKEYCDIIPVTKNEGTFPLINLDQNEFPEVAEGDNILTGELVTTDLPFKCAKHGLIQSLASELVDDAEVEIENLCEKNFVEIVTRAENTKVLKVIKDNAAVVDGVTNYEDIQLAIDKALPSVKAGLVTLTNVEGYAHLKNLKDTQKRPLNLVTNINGVDYFHGKPLVVVDDSLLPVSEGKNQVFYVLNWKEAVKYFDRKAVTIARSEHAGFGDDTVKLRVLERFAVAKGSTRSIKKLEF